MKKVLFIAFYFNQTNEIASKRLRGLAKYLPKFGWEPIIVTPKLDETFENNQNHEFKIIETEYEDMLDKWINKFKETSKYKLPLRGLTKYLPKFSWEPINIGTKFDEPFENKQNQDFEIIETEHGNILDYKLNNSNIIKETSNTHDNNFNIDKNLKNENNYNNHNKKIKKNNKLLSKTISLAGEIFAYPDGMKYWYKPAIDVTSEIIENNQDINGIISSSWPVTSHIIANDLKKQFNISWIADLRDLWNMNPYVSHTFIRNYFEKRLELKTFENVNAITTTTELAASKLKELHPNVNIYPVLSGFDHDDILNIENSYTLNKIYQKNNINYRKDILNFTYAGSLYGGKRDPTLLFKGISQLNEEGKIDISRIAIDFYGDCGNLEEIANEYNIRSILNIHGSVSHKEVLTRQKESQVLLLISWNNKKEEMFIPGKVYEYLAVKRPILSIGYKTGSLKDLIVKTNVGYHVSTLDQTKDALMKFYNEFISNKTVSYESNDKVNSYSMLNTAKKFGKILDSVSNN